MHDAFVAQLGNRIVMELHRVNSICIRRILGGCIGPSARRRPVALGEHAAVLRHMGQRDEPSAWALATAAAPSNRIASLGSLQNFGGFLGGALAPILTGYIAQSFSFVPALLTGAAIAFLGALSYLFLVHKPIPDGEAAAHGTGLRAAE